jgi:hypothetical protein
MSFYNNNNNAIVNEDEIYVNAKQPALSINNFCKLLLLWQWWLLRMWFSYVGVALCTLNGANMLANIVGTQNWWPIWQACKYYEIGDVTMKSMVIDHGVFM